MGYLSYKDLDTPTVFQHYGFVEQMPQRWYLESPEVGDFSFDIDDDGKVLFRSLPTRKVIALMEEILDTVLHASARPLSSPARNISNIISVYRSHYLDPEMDE